MSDLEQPALADSATVDTTASTQVEPTEQNAEAIQADAALAAELAASQPTEAELADVDFDGEKFKVPAKLKDAFLRYRDYTQKTQETAEEKRAAQAERVQIQEERKTSDGLKKEEFQLWGLDNRLQQLSQVNLQTIRQQNPEYAEQLRDEFIKLQGIRPQLLNSITQKSQAMQLAERERFANLASKADAFLKREIKDWSPAKDAEMESYARGEGIDTKGLAEFMLKSPAIVRVLDKAAKFDQLMKKQLAKPPAPPATPVSRISPAASPATKDPDRMNADEWRKWRDEQIATRNKKR